MKTEKLIKSVVNLVIERLENCDAYNGAEDYLSFKDGSLYNSLYDFFTNKNNKNSKLLASDLIEYFSDSDYEWYNDDEGECSEEHDNLVEEVSAELKKMKHNTSVKKNSKMSLVKRTIGTVMDDSKEIAIRMGAQQLAKAVREPLTAMLISGLQLENSDSMRAKVAGFLQSDPGLGLVSLICSIGVKSLPLPGVAEDLMEGLSKELRLQSEMAIATPVVELVASPMRLLLTQKVLELPIPGLTPQLPSSATAVLSSMEEDVSKSVVKKTSKKTTKKPVKKASKKKTASRIVVKEIVPQTVL